MNSIEIINQGDNPLVSIIVITYNSSKFVLETLESAKAQTYQNIELIVSDDCSTDNTVEICRQWLEENKERFVRTELISTEKNSGIPANCNRGVRASKGEWVKLIAGDDILLMDSIEKFINFSTKNPCVKIIESVSVFFKHELNKKSIYKQQNLSDTIFFNSIITSSEQYELMLRKNYVHAPSVIIHREVFYKINGFDEKFRLIEDHPFWLKALKAGYKFYFMNKETVYYRVHSSSVFASIDSNILFNDYYKKRRGADKKYIYPYIDKIEVFFKNAEFYRKNIIDSIGLNKRNFFGRGVNFVINRLSPIGYYTSYKIKKIEKDILSRKKNINNQN